MQILPVKSLEFISCEQNASHKLIIILGPITNYYEDLNK